MASPLSLQAVFWTGVVLVFLLSLNAVRVSRLIQNNASDPRSQYPMVMDRFMYSKTMATVYDHIDEDDEFKTVAVPIIGEVVNARACWLDPAWGTLSNGTSDTTLSPCVGKNPIVPNTTARRLTCPHNHKRVKPNPVGVTIALLYYGKPSMLMYQLDHFASYPNELKRNLTILIVDDGSPVGLRASEYVTESVIAEIYSSIRIRMARVITEKNWNIGGARNLAFYIADTTHVMLLDLDTFIPIEAMMAANSWKIKDGNMTIAHRFNRIKPSGKTGKHPAVSLLDLESYWKCGACDEDFCGNYGYTDVHFWARWKKDPHRILVDHLETFIVEYNHAPCNATYLKGGPIQVSKCESALHTLPAPSKKHDLNKAKIIHKTKTGCWSNKYLRFRWVLER